MRDYTCSWRDCDHESVGWTPNGYSTCASHAVRSGITPIPHVPKPSPEPTDESE